MKIALLVAALFAATPLFAPTALAQTAPAQAPTGGEPRLALVIGNTAYRQTPLPNAKNDAQAMAASLRKLGFTVIERIDATKKAMEESILEFGEKLRAGGVGLFYYAGHGVQSGGRNYLMPIDVTATSEASIRVYGVEATLVLDLMADSRNRANLMILDACRNNPFMMASRGASKGLAAIDAARGTLIAYSTSPGQVAIDGDGQSNSPYTAALVKALEEPGLKAEDVFKQVRRQVADATKGAQTPWESSSLTGDLILNLSITVKAAPMATREQADLAFWSSIATSADRHDFEDYLKQFPSGTFAGLANRRLAEITRREQVALEERKRKEAEAEKIRLAAADVERKKQEEAEKKRLAAEAEKQRLAALEAERQRKTAEEVERKRIAAEEAEKKRLAAEAEKQRLAALEEERKRKAAEDAERKRIAAEEAEKKRVAAEAEKQRLVEIAAERQRKIAEETERKRLVAEEAAAKRVAAQDAERKRTAIASNKETANTHQQQAALQPAAVTPLPSVSKEAVAKENYDWGMKVILSGTFSNGKFAGQSKAIYRNQPEPKAIAGCFNWRGSFMGTGGSVLVWGMGSMDETRIFAIDNCNREKGRSPCQCQIIDENDKNHLQIPEDFYQAVAHHHQASNQTQAAIASLTTELPRHQQAALPPQISPATAKLESEIKAQAYEDIMAHLLPKAVYSRTEGSNAGKPYPYRKLSRSKAYAICISWEAYYERFASHSKLLPPGIFRERATSNRPNASDAREYVMRACKDSVVDGLCECQVLDVDDQNVLDVPGSFLQRATQLPRQQQAALSPLLAPNTSPPATALSRTEVAGKVYERIMSHALTSKTSSGKPNVYRSEGKPKAFAACIDWSRQSLNYGPSVAWGFNATDSMSREPFMRLRRETALSRCNQYKTPGCECQIVDEDDKSVLQVPDEFYQQVGAASR